ncbi:MAG: phosphatase PAP2-related protein [Verrucomicrobiota bacterium]
MLSATAYALPLLAAVSPWLWAARVGVIVVGLGLWHWTQQLIARRAPVTPAGGGVIADGIHQLTAGWHRRLQADPRRADALLLVSSLVIDLLGLGLITSAVLGPTFRPFLGLIMLFGLRQFCQALCPLPPPPGMIWRSPGFPSLLVTYGVNNDLFFSGHTAIAVFGAATLATAYGPLGLALGAALVVFEIVAVLALRAHYTLDVFAGAVTALWVYSLTGKIAPVADTWLAGLIG